MNMEESNNGSKKLQIRNSTAEFLIFQIENKEEGIEVLYQDETLWLTQKTMSILFDVDIRTINEHLKNIYSQGEVDKNTTIRKNRIVQKKVIGIFLVKFLFIVLMPSFQSAIASTPCAPLNFGNGVHLYFGSLPFVDMSLIKSEWRTDHSSMKITLNICLLKSGKYD